MVSTERHGEITLEYKPCHTHCTCSEYSLTEAALSRIREPNGSKDKVQAHITSALVGNNIHLENKSALYSSHYLPLEPISYNSINLTPSKKDTKTGCKKCQYLESLPYLEIPAKSRPRLTVEPVRHFRPTIVLPRFLKTCSFRFFIISIIISMLLLCSETIAVSVERNEYLTHFNETSMAAISGQCLTVTGSVIENFCQQPVRHRKASLRQNTYKTNFCGLPLDNVLSYEEKLTLQTAPASNCSHVVDRVLLIDEELSRMHCEFSNVVNRIDCKDYFPTIGGCGRCKAAYRRWLCSVYNIYYIQDEPIKPCLDFCDQVSEYCPFFRPYGEVVIGEPGFLCKDSKSAFMYKEDSESNVYGPDSCCFKPCHVYDTDGTGSRGCSELTLNCTVVANSTAISSSVRHEPNHVIFTSLICWILCSFLVEHFTQFSVNFLNGLT